MPKTTTAQRRRRLGAPAGQGTTTTSGPQTLGTFGGVFTPSLLTILGLVLFLRVGSVTGNVGLAQMLLILGLALTVSVLTTISLAAIATNLRVGGGGVYYLISRTLGPAFGGSIGLVLYLAMSISIAFYAIGLGEAVAALLEADDNNLPRLIAAITIFGLLGLAWLGADIATRLQFVVMALLAVAIVAYFVGVIPDLSAGQLADNISAPPGGDDFWISFAIFFPAITGFTQGVAMSGDLRTPSRSITIGTFAAIGVSAAVYLLVIVTFAGAVPLADLRADTAIMRRLAPAPILVDVGVIAATLSSAIASMLGAPRTLQRLGADRLVKPLVPFGNGSGPSNNPRRATLLSTAIALGAVALGDLDLIAPIIAMFFLASYGMINYATFSEARAASTSFRPTFRWFHRRLSLAGTIACLGAILAIDPVAGGAAGLAVVGLYRYLQRSNQQQRWADSTRGFHAAEVRTHLQELTTHGQGRDWRPVTAAFAPRDPTRRHRLSTVAGWLEGRAGFTTIMRIVPGRGPVARKHAGNIELQLRAELDAFPQRLYGRVVVAPDLETGTSIVLQGHGLGALKTNLAAFSWFDPGNQDRSNNDSYVAMVQTAIRFGVNSAVVSAPDGGWDRMPTDSKTATRIAVWWPNDHTGQLLTLLAWMTTRGSIWANADIQIWTTATTETDPVAHVRGLLDDARIQATVMGTAHDQDFSTLTADAHVVFAPLRVRNGVCLGPGDQPLDDTLSPNNIAVFAHAATEVPLDVQPDESEEATLAAARDRANEASERAAELDQEAGALIVAAEMLRLEAASEPHNTDLAGELASASSRASAAHRRYLDARARADEAWRLVREIDPATATTDPDSQLWETHTPTTSRNR